MLVYVLLLAALVIPVSCQLGCEGYRTIIKVSNEFASDESSDCWHNSTNIIVCKSVTKALNHNLTDTCIYIYKDGNISKNVVLGNIQKFKLTAGSVRTLTCQNGSIKQPNIGIAFKNSVDIVIHKINFKQCGGKQLIQGWSINESPLHVFVGIYFKAVTNISLISAKVSSSYGYGIALFDSQGTVILQTVDVINGRAMPLYINHTRLGNVTTAGGIYIEYSKDYTGSGNVINITSCNLIMNYGADRTHQSVKDDDLPFGKGGGVTIFVLGKVMNISILINDTVFDSNSASWGGGAYVYLSAESRHNNIIFDRATFMLNEAIHAGGGAYIMQRFPENTVVFSGSCFINNVAKHGGGLGFIYFNPDERKDFLRNNLLSFQDITAAPPKFQLKNSHFIQNSGVLGSAIHLQRVHAEITNITVEQNDVRLADTQPGKGALYAYDSYLILKGQNFVSRNNNTAFVLDCSTLSLCGSLRFKENLGYNGGALALYGHSVINLTSLSHLNFINNDASNKGGAMFVMIPGPPLKPWKTTELQIYKCFFWFNESQNGSPDGFKGSVTFSNNHAADEYGNDIFASSIQNCRQPLNHDLKTIITNWTNFNFSDITNRSIATNAITIDLKENAIKWHVYPGKGFQPTIKLIDERGNTVRETIDVQLTNNVSIETNEGFVVTKDSTISLSLHGIEYTKFDVHVRTTSGVPIFSKLCDQQLKYCPFGYIFHNKSKCVCDVPNNMAKGIAECYTKLYMFKDRWVPDINNSAGPVNKTISYVCPAGYCGKCNNTVSGIYCEFNISNQCDDSRNQDSRLCSQCLTINNISLSVPLGGAKCINCTGKHWYFVWLTPVIFCGLSIFVLLVLWLNLDIMSYYINVALYSYQIMDILYTSDQQMDPFLSLITSIAQSTTKNSVYPATCLWHGVDNLQKMAYSCIIPVSMLITQLLVYIYARCHTNAYFSREKCLRAFTIVGVMAFSDFARISFQLLNPVEINGTKYVYIFAHYEYFGQHHLPYGILGIVIFVIFVFIIPLLLMASPWLSNLHCGKIGNPFRHLQLVTLSFNYCLKENKSWFICYYFFARLTIYAVGIFMLKDPFQISILALICLFIFVLFGIILPYKDAMTNFVETLLLANITTIAILSLAVESVYLEKRQKAFKIIVTVLSYVPLLVVFGRVIYLFIHNRTKHRKRIGGSGPTPIPARPVMDNFDNHEYHVYDD